MRKTTSKPSLPVIISSLLLSTTSQVHASEIPTLDDSEIASLTPPHVDINREEALESKIREQLGRCIINFPPQSDSWYSFNDALGELNEYGHVTSQFTIDALESHGVNNPEHDCYRANTNIIKLIEIIYGENI